MLFSTLLPQSTLHQTVCVVGAGGKTTLIATLAKQAAAHGRRCAIATTTHYCAFSQTDFIDGSGNDAAQINAVRAQLNAHKIVYTGTPTAAGKLSACGDAMWQTLVQNSDLLLVEADGSRRLPIKFPNQTEPVFPPRTDVVLVVMGLSALGKKLCEVCHRYPLACDALGCAPDAIVTPALLVQIIVRGYGKFKDRQMRVVFNQADSCTPALAMQTQTLSNAHFPTFLISAQKGCFECSF
ncbi:MAG: selenium cofactor biosynthesis protein YqeC [Ruthenibacterium sp.]